MSLSKTLYHPYQFSTNYLVLCKVYTDVGGLNSYAMFVGLYVR